MLYAFYQECAFQICCDQQENFVLNRKTRAIGCVIRAKPLEELRFTRLNVVVNHWLIGTDVTLIMLNRIFFSNGLCIMEL